MLRLDGVLIRQGEFALSADWGLEPGAFCAVIGPSGAGKSTLLSAIAGFTAPTAGRVLWDGADLTPLRPAARPVTMLFQDNNLLPHLDVAANTALGISPDLHLTKGDRARTEAALARVGLAGFGRRLPAELSGGEQGRVVLARALLRQRPLMLLDEPFAALGPALRRDMLALVRAVASEIGATVLMVSHAPEDARAADQLVFVDRGVAGTPRAAAAALAQPEPGLAAYLGS